MRPNVLSIAGFDPSAGAGILADIKVFENHKVYGFGVCTTITYQNDTDFIGLKWLNTNDIIKQIEVLTKKFNVDFAKIGIIKDLETLNEIIDFLILKNNEIKIIWDPVLKSSSEFIFHDDFDKQLFHKILRKIYLITPNFNEFQKIYNTSISSLINKENYCNLLVTGINNISNNTVEDVLISKEGLCLTFKGTKINSIGKHGTGCSLSASITANLALGNSLEKSCQMAKQYVEKLILSNNKLLAYHNI